MKSRKLFKVCVYTVFVMACISNLAIGDQDGLESHQFQSVVNESIPDILSQISTQIRENYGRIRTWKGDVEFTNNKIIKGDAAEEAFRNKTTGQGKTPQSIWRSASGTIKFIIDIKNDSSYEYFFRPEPMQYINVDTSTLLSTLPEYSMPVQETTIISPKEYLHCTPKTFRDTTILSRRVIKEERTTVLKETIFDPRDYFFTSQLLDNLANCQKRFEKNGEEPNLPSPVEKNGEDLIDLPSPRFEESRDGNDIVYHILIPFYTATKTQYIFVSMYFASEAGFNIVKSEILGPEQQKHLNTEIKYSTIDGIYLPYSINCYSYDISDGSIVSERTYVFKDQQSNQTIPAETFTYKNLGLKDGDKFRDKILNKEYTYQVGELVEVEKAKK